MIADRFDIEVRAHVFDVTLQLGDPPSVAEVAAGLRADVAEVRAALERLAAGRVLVLERGTGEILMANPFSAVPTPFLVETDDLQSFGNCIWDALGIAAMRGRDARIVTSCGCCGNEMELRVTDGEVQGDGIIHFAIPARRWWEDIVFT